MFLDHASTTRVHKAFLDAITAYASDCANPSSNHVEGLRIRNFMENYKKFIIKKVNEFYNTEFTHFILTSGATESINTVFHAFYNDEQGAFCLTDDIEHKATLESIEHWCNDKRYSNYKIFSYKNPEIPKINSYRVLLSLMSVNNETGLILYNDKLIDEIHDKSKAEQFFVHCDNTQGFMKTRLDLHKCDMMTFSGHKIGTFKGIGGIFLNDRSFKIIKRNPLLVGGNQQYGIRAGTENPVFIYALYHLILELGLDWGYEKNLLNAKLSKSNAKNALIELAKELNLELVFNEDPNFEHSPYILNFAFKGIEGESILTMLTNDCLATTSACNSDSLNSSYVLKAMDVPSAIANCALRMSFNNDNVTDVVSFINGSLKDAISKLAQIRVRKTK